MLKRVRTLATEGRHIPYDDALDFAQNDALSCEEVAYDAYNTAGSGRVKLPWSEERYVMHNTFRATMGAMLWKTRTSHLFWPFFSNMTGIPQDFEKAAGANRANRAAPHRAGAWRVTSAARSPKTALPSPPAC